MKQGMEGRVLTPPPLTSFSYCNKYARVLFTTESNIFAGIKEPHCIVTKKMYKTGQSVHHSSIVPI